MGDDEWTWSLGFGSNMDAKALVTKKGLNVKGTLSQHIAKF